MTSNSQPHDGGSRVLYVDDEPDLQRLIALQLSSQFQVVTAGSGPEALAKLRQEGPFSVVVSDLCMPRMDGAELLSRVQVEHPEVVRILLTGNGDLNSAIKAINQYSVFRYLTKPCPRPQLLEAVQAAEHVFLTQRSPTDSGKLATAPTYLSDRPSATPEKQGPGPGTLLAGRYELEKKLGEGSQATIYEAIDGALGQHVAVKLFKPGLAQSDHERIKRELTVARRLTHPNIVRLHDLGTHEDQLFISMELLEGENLRARMARAPVSIEQALDIIVQACAALEHAHARHVYHRDVKPENFVLLPNASLRLTDFGLAKHLPSASITQPGTLAGTFSYMAPEQRLGLLNATHQSDIYSVGVVGYELLTGELPFGPQLASSIVQQKHTEEVLPPSVKRRGLSDKIDPVILQCLEHDPAKRPDSCAELGRQTAAVREEHALKLAFKDRVRKI